MQRPYKISLTGIRPHSTTPTQTQNCPSQQQQQHRLPAQSAEKHTTPSTNSTATTSPKNQTRRPNRGKSLAHLPARAEERTKPALEARRRETKVARAAPALSILGSSSSLAKSECNGRGVLPLLLLGSGEGPPRCGYMVRIEYAAGKASVGSRARAGRGTRGSRDGRETLTEAAATRRSAASFFFI